MIMQMGGKKGMTSRCEAAAEANTLETDSRQLQMVTVTRQNGYGYINWQPLTHGMVA